MYKDGQRSAAEAPHQSWVVPAAIASLHQRCSPKARSGPTLGRGAPVSAPPPPEGECSASGDIPGTEARRPLSLLACPFFLSLMDLWCCKAGPPCESPGLALGACPGGGSEKGRGLWASHSGGHAGAGPSAGAPKGERDGCGQPR